MANPYSEAVAFFLAQLQEVQKGQEQLLEVVNEETMKIAPAELEELQKIVSFLPLLSHTLASLENSSPNSLGTLRLHPGLKGE